MSTDSSAQTAFLNVAAEPTFDMTSIQLLEWAASQAPGQIAIKQPLDGFGEEVVWTYAELLAKTRQLASFLSSRFAYGDHLAMWAPNSAAWLLYEFAAAHLGLVLVTVNPASRSAELEYMLSRSQAKGVVIARSYRGNDMLVTVEALRPVLPHLREVLLIDDWREHLGRAAGDPPPSPTKPSDPALIVFTSGTTGKPKAAVLHHFGVVNNPRIGAERLGMAKRPTWLASLPMFHVGGTATMCMGAVSQMATQIIMPQFDPETVLRLIEKERINFTALVPAMMIAMAEHPSFKSFDLSSFRNVQVGGTTITPAFVKLVREAFGCKVQVVFGQTECCGELTKTLPGEPDIAVEETVGAPFPGTSLKIADAVTGETLSVGQTGEIRLRSPFASRGYFQDAAATAALFDGEGFLRTGDLGLIDEDGRVRINGRLKEMIIRGGENIYPREIEDALAEFPGISESAVFGVAHPKWGEEVAAALRLTGPDIQLDDVKAFLLTRIARHKIPKHWQVVQDFPRNPSGKTQKFELRRLFEEAAAR
jgi:fatty-acyl-CoA synthase